MNKTFVALFLLVVPALLHAAAPSTVALKSSATTVEYGHAVTFTASISPSAATGKVTFYRGTMVLETEPVVKGVAVFTTSLLPSGGHAFTAYYSGDGTYAPSTSAGVSIKVKTVPSNGFGAPLDTPLSGITVTFAVGDFNGDGKADIAVVNGLLAEITVALGNGDGTFGAPLGTPSSLGLTMAVGDFNGDGREDIVMPTFPFGVTVALGNGDGTFQAPIFSPSGGNESRSIAVGDFNGDGKADLALTNNFGSGGVDVVLGNGDGTFQTAVTYEADIFPTSVLVGEFNGDGKADLAVTYGAGVRVLLGNGDGTFQAGLNDADQVFADSAATGDFNADGKADLAISGINEAEVLLSNGDGTFQPGVYYPLQAEDGGEATIAVGDLNGDGKLDLFGFTGGDPDFFLVSVALGNGDGTFQAVQNSVSIGPAIGGILLADFNGDGRVDVLEATYNGPTMPVVLLGSPAAYSTTTLTSSLNPSEVGQSVMLTASISPITSAGSVTFYLYSYTTGSAQVVGESTVANGTAAVALAKLPAGTDTVYAVYVGDTQVLPSDSNTITQQVNFDPDSIVLSSSPNPSASGQTITMVATVRPAAATGNVFFNDGETAIGQATLVQGKATFTSSTLSLGTHLLTATYNGSSKYAANTSAPISQLVN